jgi:hypothetical protein
LYKSSGFRFNKLHLDQLLNDLVIVNLLKKYERGAVSYRSHLDVYVKLLPSSLEQQTVANWQASTLDQLKLSWSTYSASCSTLRYPSAIAKFSNDLDHLLKTDPYKE